MDRFEYYFMNRNGLWSEYCQEVEKMGFENASPLARLIYSCEIGSGIDQHASEDLKAVSATIAALHDQLARLEAAAREYVYEAKPYSFEKLKAALTAPTGEKG